MPGNYGRGHGSGRASGLAVLVAFRRESSGVMALLHSNEDALGVHDAKQSRSVLHTLPPSTTPACSAKVKLLCRRHGFHVAAASASRSQSYQGGHLVQRRRHPLRHSADLGDAPRLRQKESICPALVG